MAARRVLVCGAGGFIGSHMVRRLRSEGYWVRGADLKHPEFGASEADTTRLWLSTAARSHSNKRKT